MNLIYFNLKISNSKRLEKKIKIPTLRQFAIDINSKGYVSLRFKLTMVTINVCKIC